MIWINKEVENNMVEQYVIEEIKKLKEENEKLKQELNDEKNKLVMLFLSW